MVILGHMSCIGAFTLMFYALGFFPYHQDVGSPVPCKSLCHAPVTSMPAAIRTVIRFLTDLSQLLVRPLVLTAMVLLTTPNQPFTFVQLHDTHLTDLLSAFSYHAQYRRF